MTDYKNLNRLSIIKLIEEKDKEIESLKKGSKNVDFMKEVEELVAKCNELSNENFRLKKDLHTIRQIVDN